jgi:hypothetical protein
MKTIIAGSRSIQLYSLIPQSVKASGFSITELVCGCAPGVDRLGFVWARKNYVPVRFFPAWEKQHQWAMENWWLDEIVEPHLGEHWRAAGHIRNAEMAKYADALILVWDGQSAGSKSMLAQAKSKGLKIYERIV